MDLLDAYHVSMQRLLRFIESAVMLVDEVSVYMLSKENLKREAFELDAVLETEDYFLRNLMPELCRKYAIRVVHAGEKRYLPDFLRQSLAWLCEETCGFQDKTVNLLLGYNPLDEINAAFARTGGKVEIKDLLVSSEVDVVIRTGGGRVISSNFLPLQCAYSSFYIIDEYFNDFTDERFKDIYNDARDQGAKMGK